MHPSQRLFALFLVASAAPAFAWPILPWGAPEPIHLSTSNDPALSSRETGSEAVVRDSLPVVISSESTSRQPREAESSAMKPAFSIASAKKRLHEQVHGVTRRRHVSREAELLALMGRAEPDYISDALQVAGQVLNGIDHALRRREVIKRREQYARVAAALLDHLSHHVRSMDDLD